MRNREILIDLSGSTDVFKINLTSYKLGSIDGVKNERQFIRNEYDESGETAVVNDEEFHSTVKFDTDEREAIVIDELIITNKYLQSTKEMYYVVNVLDSIIDKVNRHCDEVGLVCRHTILCDTLIFYVKDYAMSFENYNDRVLKNVPDALIYSQKIKNIVEGSIKTCFSSIVWL